jgi:hypothetical protein
MSNIPICQSDYWHLTDYSAPLGQCSNARHDWKRNFATHISNLTVQVYGLLVSQAVVHAADGPLLYGEQLR